MISTSSRCFLRAYRETGVKKVIGTTRAVPALRADGTEFAMKLRVTAIDNGDGEAYADCFTDDGVIELQRSGLHVQGRDALVEFAREDHARSGAARHLTNSPIIEGDISTKKIVSRTGSFDSEK